VRASALLAFALALACAPARKPIGELVVHPVHELFPQMSTVHEAAFRLEHGRLTGSGAHAGADLDLVAMDDGCIRGDVFSQHLQICPAPAASGDPQGLYRWQSMGMDGTAFATQLLDLGDRLRIEAGRTNVELAVPPGPVGDELRSHPELLGAAFAFGLFPASSDPRDLWVYEARTR
jgi:hypothetical protein